MKRFSLMALVIGVFLVMAAGSAEAQCFDCVQQSGSNPDRPNMYCAPDGTQFSSCTTVWNTDPNTCEQYSSCGNAYTCASEPPGGGPYCDNSHCDGSYRWEIQTMQDVYRYNCYHYGTQCQYTGWN